MKTAVVTLIVALGLVSVLIHPANAQANGASNDTLIAIDILLQPDQAMISKANAVNTLLRGNYPGGYSLDATHAPHVTLLQRFVRVKDLDAVTAAVAKVYAAQSPIGLQLKAESLDYVLWGGVAVTVFVVERTPELMQFHEKIIAAVEPFSVSGGTAAAFVGDDANSDTIGWVEHFIPDSSGPKYIPHVTLGVAHEDFVKGMKAEPFDGFTFKVAGAAVYHLGNFGTAAKKLWRYKPAVK
jgi:2'-5' RNA ligase superfamily